MKQATTDRKAMENKENTQPKFSPGPWRVEFHALEHQVIVDADGHYVCGSSFRPAVERPRARANVKLAAAAPEMYEMLDMLASCGCISNGIYTAAIRKLLAKARGEEKR